MILVVAAVLVDDLAAPTRILAARRRTPAALAGFWEFPGGKVEPAEDPVDALHRELAEELQITVELGSELENPAGGTWPISAEHEMRLWFARINSGVPTATGSHDCCAGCRCSAERRRLAARRYDDRRRLRAPRLRA